MGVEEVCPSLERMSKVTNFVQLTTPYLPGVGNVDLGSAIGTYARPSAILDK